MARDVTEAQLQSTVIGSSGIACVVTVTAVVDGRAVETSGQDSAFSSVHIIVDHVSPDHVYIVQLHILPNTTRKVICGSRLVIV